MLRKIDSPATSLLISMLIRYPELSSVRYEPMTQSLVFSFFIQEEMNSMIQSTLFQEMSAYFEAWSAIDRNSSKMGTLQITPLDRITLITYQQAITSISTSEIVFLIHILQTHFHGQVAGDPLYIDEDELEMQENLINKLLGHRESLHGDQQVVAYREDGKVFVYNR